MPTRIRRTGLELFPAQMVTIRVEMAAPIKAPEDTLYSPKKENQPR